MEFLTSQEATERTRIILRGSVLLWLGALTAWLIRADATLLEQFDTTPFFIRLHPIFEWYTDWGVFIFYVLFIALLMFGMRYKRPLFKQAGLAYVYAQLFGTFLLIRLIKIGCGRPRPHFATVHDALCQAPSLAHAFNSFPSSHAVNVAVGAMFVFLLLRSRVAALFALTATLFMALARIAIGEHYLSDVLAGLALGVAIAGFVMRVYLLPRWRAIETAATQ
jgi:membrane-associated phospholipid phosphatase